MNLNGYIDKARQVSQPNTGIPVPDRTEQTNLGLDMAQRMATQAQNPLPPPTPMKSAYPPPN